jgi:hypothetical protein
VFAADPFTFIKFATEHQETAGCAGKQLVFRHTPIGSPEKTSFAAHEAAIVYAGLTICALS